MNIRYWFVLLNLCLPTAYADTPFMLLKDTDGVVNVRDARNPITVIARLRTPQVVASYGAEYPEHKQYHLINYRAKQDVSAFHRYAALNPPAGLVHNSRLQALDSLPQFEAVQQNGQQTFRHGNSRIEIRYEPLNPERHRLGSLKNGAYHTLDGQPFFGFEGSISVAQRQRLADDPIRLIQSISVQHQGRTLHFPPAAVKQMLGFRVQGVAVGDEDTWYLYGSGGDGAGAYHSVWTLKQGRPTNQFIWSY